MYSKIEEFKRKGQQKIRCDNDPFEKVSVSSLIDTIFTSNPSDPRKDPYETILDSINEMKDSFDNLTLQKTENIFKIEGNVYGFNLGNQGTISQTFIQGPISDQAAPLQDLVRAEQRLSLITQEEYEELLDIISEIKDTENPTNRQKRQWRHWLGKALATWRKYANESQGPVDVMLSEETRKWLLNGGLKHIEKQLGAL